MDYTTIILGIVAIATLVGLAWVGGYEIGTASGASAETQHAIGTGVFGGMLSGTLLAVFFVPAFFVFVIGTQERLSAWRAQRGSPAFTQENP